MLLMFDVSPHEGEMAVQAKYGKEEIKQQHFYLNRDAVIEALLCDGIETEFEVCEVEHSMFAKYGFIAGKIALPSCNESIEVRYRLKLSGQTGCVPYAQERITPEFSFIRWETFCYPMFFEDWDSFRNTSFAPSTFYLTLPAGYEAVASADIVEHQMTAPDKKRIVYSSTRQSSNIFDCAIAPYTKLDYSFGSVYFLRLPSAAQTSNLEMAMKTAHDYMIEHFGYREIQGSLSYASIPDGFGSFAYLDIGVIFIQESTFDNVENLNQIVHEFIHLGWNVAVKASVQRARFFDEAFTSYFETRVMRHLLDDVSRTRRRIAQRHIEAIKTGDYQLVPLCEYGAFGYGDLSYTIGSLCLEELCSLLGEELFDAATAAFLKEYQEIPADFEDFCASYKSLSGAANEEKLTTFFEDWIHSTKAMKKIIDQADCDD